MPLTREVMLTVLTFSKKTSLLCDFNPILLQIFVILPLFQVLRFDRFAKDAGNKIRHNFMHSFYYYKYINMCEFCQILQKKYDSIYAKIHTHKLISHNLHIIMKS